MRQPLPIDSYLDSILETLQAHRNLVVKATPGAGKTTRLPPKLLELTTKEVWVLEPRRVAALSASQRIAQENGWRLGNEVGYQVRFENRSNANTRLLFLTEALLLKKLAQDPELSRVGIVVLDEFHERSVHSDLAIGALKELQELSREDLKMVVMSATLDENKLTDFLQAPVVEVPGKVFPLEIFHEDKSQLLTTGPAFTQRITQLILRALANPGDLLCFLPGKGEIEWVQRELEKFTDITIYPLHGQLSLDQQSQAIQKHPHRKIVLATNVAESSVTVDGVTIVVDSGLAKISELHPKTGFPTLQLARISQASATQRAGRAARIAPGKVYRAYSKYDEHVMKDFEVPEIFRVDLSETLLTLAAIGIQNYGSFSWFERPKSAPLEIASTTLRQLQILAPNGKLTDFGKSLQFLPLPPRLAALVAKSETLGMIEACDWAALLAEPASNLSSTFSGEENDLSARWDREKSKRSVQQTVQQLRSLWRGQARATSSRDRQKLFCSIYGDRLCRRRNSESPEAIMVGGRGVSLRPESTVRQSEYFLALELGEANLGESTVFQAMGIDSDLVEELFGAQAATTAKLFFSEDKSRFFVKEFREWRGLPLGKEHIRPAKPEEIEGKLGALLVEKWQLVLQKNAALQYFFARLTMLEKFQPQFPLPSPEQIREACELAAFGENSLQTLLEKDLVPYFVSVLSKSQQEALARECPEVWQVPSGSRIRVQYSTEQGPFVEVRLQELFGLENQPKIAGQPLTLFLLAPNFRPVQVTKDLASFWNHGYQEVRKELRSRYPKHSWPEDPWRAIPQAKGRPRQSL